MVPGPAAAAILAPVGPFVEQLILQADSLNAISRRVESQLKREGIPVLAATREFVDLATGRSSRAVKSPLGNGGLQRTSPPLRSDRVEAAEDDLASKSTPANSEAPFTAFTPAPPRREYDLDVAPFADLSQDVAPPIPFDPPSIPADHLLTDWADPKSFHGNDHGRSYDKEASTISEGAEVHVESFAPAQPDFVSAAPNPPVMAEAVPPPVFPPLASEPPIGEVLDRLSRHYRERAESGANVSSIVDWNDAALEQDVPPAEIKPGIPGQIANPYMVTVNGDLEIPKVPPFIWCAPEMPWDRDDASQDPYVAWFNCNGNRFQLSLEF